MCKPLHRPASTEQRAAVAARLVELRKNKRRTLLRQVSAGLKESDEKDLADLDVDEAENVLRRAVAVARIEKRKLASLVEPTGTLAEDLAMDPDLLSVPASFTADTELVQKALSRRAEMEVIQATCGEYEVEQKLAKNKRYPWISFVEVSYRVTYLPERGPWGWKFGVDLPFFRSAAAAEAKIAAAREARCHTQYKALATTIRSEVETAIANLEALRSELVDVDRLRSGPAERAFQRAQVALKAGRADHIDVFDAEARLLTIQDRWLERRVQYLDLESQLEAALGGPLSSTH
jgi:outer membrane protein TolC